LQSFAHSKFNFLKKISALCKAKQRSSHNHFIIKAFVFETCNTVAENQKAAPQHSTHVANGSFGYDFCSKKNRLALKTTDTHRQVSLRWTTEQNKIRLRLCSDRRFYSKMRE